MSKKLNIYGESVLVKKLNLEKINLLGFYSADDKSVTICSTLKGDAYKRTLLHEVVHAIMEIQGWSQTSFVGDLQELICEHISTALCDNFDISAKRKKR